MSDGFDPGPGDARPVGDGQGSELYEELPPMRPVSHRSRRPSRRRRLFGLVMLIAIPLIIVVLAVTAWYQVNEHALGPAGRQEVIIIRPGESENAVLSALHADHVIASTWAFRLSDFLDGQLNISPGGYALNQNETYGQVRAVFAAAPNIYPITVEPGYALKEVGARVDVLPGHQSSSFSQVAASGAVRSTFSPAGSDNLEGLLGTGNYLVVPGESDAQILGAMVTRFEQQAATAGLTTASASALGYSPYQLITAASVVEKEGYIKKNMPDVARVIDNRLADSMPLQMDATVLYALGQDGGTVTPADEQVASPYNTYLNKGLPPTPICSPSPTALAAVVHPPAGGWLYFELVQKDGTEAFADTYTEQLANEQLAHSRGLG